MQIPVLSTETPAVTQPAGHNGPAAESDQTAAGRGITGLFAALLGGTLGEALGLLGLGEEGGADCECAQAQKTQSVPDGEVANADGEGGSDETADNTAEANTDAAVIGNAQSVMAAAAAAPEHAAIRPQDHGTGTGSVQQPNPAQDENIGSGRVIVGQMPHAGPPAATNRNNAETTQAAAETARRARHQAAVTAPRPTVQSPAASDDAEANPAVQRVPIHGSHGGPYAQQQQAGDRLLSLLSAGSRTVRNRNELHVHTSALQGEPPPVLEPARATANRDAVGLHAARNDIEVSQNRLGPAGVMKDATSDLDAGRENRGGRDALNQIITARTTVDGQPHIDHRVPDVAAKSILNNLTDNVVKAVRYLATRQGKTMTVRLVPESLGELRLEVVSRDELVYVRLLSTNQGVRNALESNSHILRQALAREGLDIGSLVVATDTNTSSNAGGKSQWAGWTASGNHVTAPASGPKESSTSPPIGHGSTAHHEGYLNVFV